MAHPIRTLLLPEAQRRTLRELSDDLDLRSGDRRSRYSAYWTMLTLSAVIASAGVLVDSTATVIGAMIIAPLSTPIMGTALGLARQKGTGAFRFVVGGVVLVVAIGLAFSILVPDSLSLVDNPQVAGRTSPSILDMIAALATGLAGAVAIARRDVAAVLPGVAIAISLVPPLAVVGLCLGHGDGNLAIGAFLLFVSNVLALVLAGTLVYAVLGYSGEAMVTSGRSPRRTYAVLVGMIAVVSLPLLANTLATYALTIFSDRVERAARTWVSEDPDAEVTGVEYHGLIMTIDIETPDALPPTDRLLDALADELPEFIGITVHRVQGESVEVRQPQSRDR